MATTMRAYRLLDDGGGPRWTTVAVPEPPAGGALLAVDAVGLCHSDLAISAMPVDLRTRLGWQPCFTLGHEITGRILALGPDVTDDEPGRRVGDRVLVASGVRCGACWFCERGEDHNCVEAAAGPGYGRDGGLADRMAVADATSLVDVGELDPIDVAPLSDAAATSYHAVERILPKLDPGAHLVLIGCGGLGTYALQIVRALSATPVTVVDIDPSKRTQALDLGADDAVAAITANHTSAWRHRERRGVDVVLDFVGSTDTIRSGLSILRPGGSFGLVGAEGGGLDARAGWYHALPADGEVFTFQGSSRHDLHRVLDLARGGAFTAPVQVFGSAEVDRAYELLRTGGLTGRAVIDLRR